MLDNRCIGLKSSLQTKPPTAIEGGVTGCRRITRVLHQLWTVALLEGSMRLDIDMFWIPRAHSLLCTTSHSHPARPPVGNPCLFRGSDPLHFFHDLYFTFPLHLTSSNGYNAMSLIWRQITMQLLQIWRHSSHFSFYQRSFTHSIFTCHTGRFHFHSPGNLFYGFFPLFCFSPLLVS